MNTLGSLVRVAAKQNAEQYSEQVQHIRQSIDELDIVRVFDRFARDCAKISRRRFEIRHQINALQQELDLLPRTDGVVWNASLFRGDARDHGRLLVAALSCWAWYEQSLDTAVVDGDTPDQRRLDDLNMAIARLTYALGRTVYPEAIDPDA